MNFLRGAILKYDVVALQCQNPLVHCYCYLSRVETGTTKCNAHTSHFKMAARRKFSDQNKSLRVNYTQRIIKFERLM